MPRVACLHAEQQRGSPARVDDRRGGGDRGGASGSIRKRTTELERRIARVVGKPDIPRQRDEGRAGPPALRGADRLADDLAQLLRRADLAAVLGDRPHERDRIERLVGRLHALLERNFAADGEHRIAFGRGGGEAGDEIADPGSGCRDRHAAASGHAPHRRRHERRVLLMTAQHQFDLRVEQRFEDAVDLRAGDSKAWVTPRFSSIRTSCCAVDGVVAGASGMRCSLLGDASDGWSAAWARVCVAS